MQRLVKMAVMVACVVLVPSAVFAQASITGTVRDTSGAVLPGVTVEAASPALIERTRSVVSDGTGQYRIVDLRPGTYSVTFSLSGFNTVKREGIELTGTFVASINAEMKVGAVEETITATGESPIVDVQNATRNRVIDKEIIDAIPTNRGPLQLAALIPGLTSSSQDVGGSSSPLGSGANVAVHGGRMNDQRITLDGVATQSALYVGACGNYLPNAGAVQEMNILVAAGNAEQPLGGVVINVIPLGGGNTFTGSFFGGFANASMQGSNVTQRLKDAGLNTPNSIKQNYDYNGAFGGRVIRDRLWFFTAVRQTGYQNYVAGLFANANAGNPNAWTYVPDPSKPVNNDVYLRSANLRLTSQARSRRSRPRCPTSPVPTRSRSP